MQETDPEAMEAMQLLSVVLAVLAVIAAYLRRSRHVQATWIMPLVPIIEVGDADDARRMIMDHATSFSNHPTVPLAINFDAGQSTTRSITTAPYGSLWRALRSNLTANIVHPSRLGHLVTVQRAAAEALVTDLSLISARGAGEAVVVLRDVLYPAVFTTAVRMCLGDGIGEHDVRTFQCALREFFHSSIDANLLASSWLARMLHWRQWRYLIGTRRRLAELFSPVIAARRKSPRSNDDDGDSVSYLDSLLDLRVPNIDAGPAGGESLGTGRPLRDDEVVRLVWEAMGSGTELITACVEWTLARLVTEPEVQRKLHRELAAGGQDRLQDLPYLRAVILETLRLHPPQPLVVREVGAEGAAVAGATLPPGGTLMRFLFITEEMGMDPKKWTDPDKFRPERFLAGGEGEDVGPVPGPKEIKMMPFGAGRRHCPGAGLSMIHVGGFVAALVRAFEWAPPPADGGGVDFTGMKALFVKVMAAPLRATITPRSAE